MARPLYYIHAAEAHTPAWENASRYRLTETKVSRLMGFFTKDLSEEQLVLEILGEQSPEATTDAILWSRTHQRDGRLAHSIYRPQTTRLSMGLVVNAEYPWLAYTPHDFTWSEAGAGENKYMAPYSKQLTRTPRSGHELQMACGAAVTEWTRPFIDYVVWTPSGSFLKEYTHDSLLVATGDIHMRNLWDEFIFPRVHNFYQTALRPALEARRLDPEQLYTPHPQQYVKVVDPVISANQLIKAFGELGTQGSVN